MSNATVAVPLCNFDGSPMGPAMVVPIIRTEYLMAHLPCDGSPDDLVAVTHIASGGLCCLVSDIEAAKRLIDALSKFDWSEVQPDPEAPPKLGNSGLRYRTQVVRKPSWWPMAAKIAKKYRVHP